MKLIDYHIHTNFSADSNSSIEDIIKKAIELGHREICFTQHVEPSTMNLPFCIAMPAEKIPEYVQQAKDAGKKFNIPIKIGLEVEYEESFTAEIRGIVNNSELDFILGSAHTIEGHPINSPKYTPQWLTTKTSEEILDKYFGKINTLIQSNLFDVISHVDIFRACWEEAYGKLKFEDYSDYAERTIQLLKENDVGFEVNSSGFRRNDEQHPVSGFIEMAYDAGVRKVTIGSDTHKTELLSKDLDKVVNLLQNIGYREIATFDKHRVTYIPISDMLDKTPQQ
jgi:histidinol-phosphatase (PHP family)